MSVSILCARHIRRLHPLTVKAVKAALAATPEVVVGSKHQGDLEIQKLLLDMNYQTVSVYQSRARPLASPEWKQIIRRNEAIDSALVDGADAGILIWDARSPAIILNVLRLLSTDKTATLICDGSGEIDVLSGIRGWAIRSAGLPYGAGGEMDIDAAQTAQSAILPESVRRRSKRRHAKSFEESANSQLAAGDTGAFTQALLALAKAQGTAHVATSSGLARTSLYRSLQSNGRLEFNTVVKVLAALGYSLGLTKLAHNHDNASDHDVAARLQATPRSKGECGESVASKPLE